MPLRVENAVDLHCHFHEDHIGGSLDIDTWSDGVPALETAREAKENGYAAVVLKAHGFASPGLARELERAVPGIALFGGICTDHPTGGLNVYAVELALALGAKIVWLPTVHSTTDFTLFPMRDRHRTLGPVPVTDDDGELLADVREIFDLVVQAEAVLATGHISADDHHAVVEAFGDSGRVLVTHAGEPTGPQLTPSSAAELADLGATIELSALACHAKMGVPGRPPEEVIEFLQVIGPERCALATDYGWSAVSIPRPAAGLLEFLERLWQLGVPEADLITAASTNPGRLLQLPFAG
jgi:hypothetical protein